MRYIVLVVEKDLQTRQTIIYMLEALNYRAVGYNTMSRALDALKAIRFDAMIMSPGAVAVGEASYAIEVKTIQPELKIIMAAGATPEDLVSAAIDAFMPKPFTVATLDDILNRVLQRSPDASPISADQLAVRLSLLLFSTDQL